ncbi:hypothetical protein Q0Z83_111100 [Actinoplanes sichuanensis]|uniref:Helix-turn-helix domain-containing protein n=1 Tax=Actinoplanes sichuanensis TaxID=512349 RepID=A0ABW4A285_9ACTN|nr:hypothetical protein [Actinoplanes sichuanensis]BEL12919.1 hypothetical protein Q0Z83_111100 [Actinoplanes sichuanensis]
MTSIASEPVPAPATESPRSRPRHVSPPVTGDAREEIRQRVVRLYQPAPGSEDRPLSIRAIAKQLKRPYGFVWNLLNEAGVPRRPAHGHKRTTP